MKWVVRILGAAAGLAVLAVLGLWLAGFRDGAGRNALTLEIKRPAGDVWRCLWEDELVKRWAVGLLAIEHLNDARESVGTRTKLVVGRGEERVEMEMEITAAEPGHRIAYKLKSLGPPDSGFTQTGEYTLVEENGRTRLSFVAVSHYFPAWIQLFEPMITPAAQKNVEESLTNLKKVAESLPTSSSSLNR